MAVLELNNVTKTFDGLVAVDNVSLSFEKGRIVSLIGPNGAGKTTLFNLITGFLRPDDGSISYCGQILNGLPPWKIARLGLGRLFQDVRVFNRLTVLENLQLAKKEQPGENPLNSLLFWRRVRRSEEENLVEAERWLEFVGLLEQKNALAENLSYGQQKLLAIARLLMNEADTLLLDEPTAGVHPVMVKEILEVIRRLAQEGRTIVVIEHNMTVVMDISHWVFFLDEGRLLTSGLPHEVLGDPVVREAYIGI